MRTTRTMAWAWARMAALAPILALLAGACHK